MHVFIQSRGAGTAIWPEGFVLWSHAVLLFPAAYMTIQAPYVFITLYIFAVGVQNAVSWATSRDLVSYKPLCFSWIWLTRTNSKSKGAQKVCLCWSIQMLMPHKVSNRCRSICLEQTTFYQHVALYKIGLIPVIFSLCISDTSIMAALCIQRFLTSLCSAAQRPNARSDTQWLSPNIS